MNDFEKCKRYGYYRVEPSGKVWDVALNHYLGCFVQDQVWRYCDGGVYPLSLGSLKAIVHWLKTLNGEE